MIVNRGLKLIGDFSFWTTLECYVVKSGMLIPFFVIRLPIYFDGFVRHHHRDEVGSFEIALPIFLKAIDVTFFHLQKEAWS